MKLKLKHSDSELEKLKELLLGDELETLAQLETKIKELALQSNDQELIVAKILPLFDTILLDRLKSEDQETITILSDYLAKIITQSSQNDTKALSLSLQSILASAVSEEIASNKDAMIDSLYPIMGGMISKYVTNAIKELMENINNKIENGLSLDRYKRKIKSKITGVSETELLLKESSEANIFSLFIIQKKSGLLISEAHLKEKEINDPHMIASMASAIKDFINDWMQSSKKHEEVQLLSYGSATLYIESAGTVYLIAFLDSEPDQDQRVEINAFFASLVKKYGKFFQKFDGDDSSKEVKSLTKLVQAYLDLQEPNAAKKAGQSKSKFTQYIIALLAIALLAMIAYWAKEWFTEHQIKSEIFKKTGEEIRIDIEEDRILAEGSVNSFDDLTTIEEIIRNKKKKSVINRITIPMIQVDKIFTEQKIISEKEIATLSILTAQLKNKLTKTDQTIEDLTQKLKEYDQNLLMLSKVAEEQRAAAQKRRDELLLKQKSIVQLMTMKDNLAKALKKSFAHSPYFNPQNNKLIFSGSQFFPEGETDLHPKAQAIVTENTDRYIAVLLSHYGAKHYLRKIIIAGHTDSDGNLQYNTRLSKKRAITVSDMLSKLDSIQKNGWIPLLTPIGYADQYSIIVNGAEDKNASRRIEIEFQFDDKQIEEDIRELRESQDR